LTPVKIFSFLSTPEKSDAIGKGEEEWPTKSVRGASLAKTLTASLQASSALDDSRSPAPRGVTALLRINLEDALMSKFDLTGRKALVTGGARGLGAGMAEALAKAGAAVMIGDILGDVGKATAKAIAASGAKAGFVPLDVTNEESWEKAVSSTIAEFGGFDVLINNAGIEITSLVINVEAADLRRMCDVNIVGASLGMKHAFRAMRPGGSAGKGGAIVSISSVAATIAFPGIAGYSATKSGVDRLTRVAAMESGKLGYGVRMNCIYPGLVPTDMGMQLAGDVVAAGLYPSPEAAVGDVIGQTPLARLGEVSDMADAVVFLCSDAARFITGVGLPVDGGMGM
jgi:3alpha(or 20beta)-hydroxysteroid dehydrogenase